MSIKLHLTIGSKVKNIRATSSRKGLIGFVVEEKSGERGGKWLVKYQNGQYGTYFKELAHVSLKRADGEVTHTCKCVHDELCQSCLSHQATKSYTLGHPCQLQILSIDYAALEQRVLANPDFWKGHPVDSLQYEMLQPKRRVLKKVRRNVISGKTQDDMVKEMGHARGVQQFNTRCIGTSTGQALRILGDAMCNPATEIRIKDIDHAISDGTVGGRMVINENFRSLVKSLMGNMKGFTFTETHIVFNPIVTEETYVETH